MEVTDGAKVEIGSILWVLIQLAKAAYFSEPLIKSYSDDCPRRRRLVIEFDVERGKPEEPIIRLLEVG